nr:MAG TPA: hypothetical protein [Bacteriophage sp.]
MPLFSAIINFFIKLPLSTYALLLFRIIGF